MRIIAAQVYPMPSLEILKEGLTQFEMKSFSMTLELEICSVAMFLKLGKQRSREKTGERDRENETFRSKNEGLRAPQVPQH